MGGSAEGRDLLLEGCDIGAQNEVAGIDDRSDSAQQLLAQRRGLRSGIQEGNRCHRLRPLWRGRPGQRD